MNKEKNILVTGGAGYIGSHVALSLLDKGYSVTILDSLITGNEKILPSKANFIKCDIADTKIISNLLEKEKFDALVHLAAFIKVEESIDKPKEYFENNVTKSKILFDICLKFGLNNFIFSSTAAVYGNTSEELITEDSKINPLNPYAESKILIEEYLKEKSNDKKLNYIILRYFNVAGSDPHYRSGLISDNPTHLIKVACEVALDKRKYIEIYGNDYPTSDGTAVRDYIHVSDLSEIHYLSIKHLLSSRKSDILNCGYGKGYSVKFILDSLNTIIKKPIEVRIAKKRKGDAVSLVADVSKIKEMLKWKPKYDKIEDILNSAVIWEEKNLNE